MCTKNAIYRILNVRAVLAMCFFLLVAPAFAQNSVLAESPKPTIVLVHGAFEDASSWDEVASLLLSEGYPVVAIANPLRGLKLDSEYVVEAVSGIRGSIVMVGHSYGGNVISVAAKNNPNVRALVYVAAFAPDVGESVLTLSTKFPGGTLGRSMTAPVLLFAGTHDLYIDQTKFHDEFAADVDIKKTELMAVTQRPITDAALGEPAEVAAWKDIPSYWIYGTADKTITPDCMAFLAQRTNSKNTVIVEGASHVVMTSRPDDVAGLINTAASETFSAPLVLHKILL